MHRFSEATPSLEAAFLSIRATVSRPVAIESQEHVICGKNIAEYSCCAIMLCNTAPCIP